MLACWTCLRSPSSSSWGSLAASSTTCRCCAPTTSTFPSAASSQPECSMRMVCHLPHLTINILLYTHTYATTICTSSHSTYTHINTINIRTHHHSQHTLIPNTTALNTHSYQHKHILSHTQAITNAYAHACFFLPSHSSSLYLSGSFGFLSHSQAATRMTVC